MKLIFAPIGVVSGLLAGLLARKGFERAWALVDDDEPPAPESRDSTYPWLIVALAVEGAVFRIVKGVVDHAVRRAFARATGRWPGEDPDEPASPA